MEEGKDTEIEYVSFGKEGRSTTPMNEVVE